MLAALLLVGRAAAASGDFWCDVPATEKADVMVPPELCIRSGDARLAAVVVSVVRRISVAASSRARARARARSKFATVKCPRTMQLLANGDIIVGSPSQVCARASAAQQPTSRTRRADGARCAADARARTRASRAGAALRAGLPPAGIGGIYILYDENKDGKADAETVLRMGAFSRRRWRVFFFSSPIAAVATGESSLHGIKVVNNNTLYYTVEDAVYSVPFNVGERTSTAPATKVADLSTGAALARRVGVADARPTRDARAGGTLDRWTHTLDYDESNKELYVTTGGRGACGGALSRRRQCREPGGRARDAGRYEGADCGMPKSDRAGAGARVGNVFCFLQTTRHTHTHTHTHTTTPRDALECRHRSS